MKERRCAANFPTEVFPQRVFTAFYRTGITEEFLEPVKGVLSFGLYGASVTVMIPEARRASITEKENGLFNSISLITPRSSRKSELQYV